jgi:hypothetical protein
MRSFIEVISRDGDLHVTKEDSNHFAAIGEVKGRPVILAVGDSKYRVKVDAQWVIKDSKVQSEVTHVVEITLDQWKKWAGGTVSIKELGITLPS